MSDIPTEKSEATEKQDADTSETLSLQGQAAMQGGDTQPCRQTVTTQESPESPSSIAPDPGDRLLSRPTYPEAKEGDRNQEDDMVEGQYDLHPPLEEDKETKPGGLKWNPHGSGERGE